LTGVTRKQRRHLIEQDVDRHWHVFVHDAAKRLVDRAAQDANKDEVG
jgi:hypothetical protein